MIDSHKHQHPTDRNRHAVDRSGHFWYLDESDGHYYGYLKSFLQKTYVSEEAPDMQPLIKWLEENLPRKSKP